MKNSLKTRLVCLLGLIALTAITLFTFAFITPTKKASALSYESGEFEMLGISIRYSDADGEDGIRFGVTLKRSIYDSLVADNNAEAGILIAPYDKVPKNGSGDRVLDLDSAAADKANARKGVLSLGSSVNKWSVGAEYVTGVVYIYGFPAASFNRPLAARAYIDWDNNGETVYYTDTVVKSMSDVAYIVREDYSGLNKYGTTQAQFEKLDAYLLTYKVDFYDDFWDVSSTQNIKYGSSFSTPANPTARTGYTLNGWLPQISGGYSDTTFDMANGDKTVKYNTSFKADYSKTSGAKTFEKPAMGSGMKDLAGQNCEIDDYVLTLKGCRFFGGDNTVTGAEPFMVQMTFTAVSGKVEYGFLITDDKTDGKGRIVYKNDNKFYFYNYTSGTYHDTAWDWYDSIEQRSNKSTVTITAGNTYTMTLIYKNAKYIVYIGNEEAVEFSETESLQSGSSKTVADLVGSGSPRYIGIMSLNGSGPSTVTDWRYSTDVNLINSFIKLETIGNSAPTKLQITDSSAKIGGSSNVTAYLAGVSIPQNTDFVIYATAKSGFAKHIGFVVGTLAAASNHLLFRWRAADIYVTRETPSWTGHADNLWTAGYGSNSADKNIALVYKNGSYYMIMNGEEVWTADDNGVPNGWNGTLGISSNIGTEGNKRIGLFTYNGTTEFTNYGYSTDAATIASYLNLERRGNTDPLSWQMSATSAKATAGTDQVVTTYLEGVEIAQNQDFVIYATAKAGFANHIGFTVGTLATSQKHMMFSWRSGDIYVWRNDGWKGHADNAYTPGYGTNTADRKIALVYKNSSYYMIMDGEIVFAKSETADIGWGTVLKTQIGDTGTKKIGLYFYKGTTEYTGYGYSTDAAVINTYVRSLGTWEYGNTDGTGITDGKLKVKGAHLLSGATVENGSPFMISATFTRTAATEFGFIVTTDNNWNGTQKNLMIVVKKDGNKFYVWGENPGLWWNIAPTITIPAEGNKMTLTLVYKNGNYNMFIDGTLAMTASETDKGEGWNRTIASVMTGNTVYCGLVSLNTATTYTDWCFTTDSARINALVSDDFSVDFTVDATKMHTDTQINYLEDSYTNVANYADGKSEKSKPLPVIISWSSASTITDAEILISEDENFDSYRTVTADSGTLNVYNLKTGTTYYYKLVGTVSGKEVETPVDTFTTESLLPRFIDCDGVTNMRDVGGYTVDGGVIRQGLLYRCGKLNQSDTNVISATVTADGIATLRYLGIKSEIDLRDTKYWDAVNKKNEVGGLTDTSVIGSDINYYQCPMDVMAGVANSVNYASVKKVFKYLADENNYPMIYHCSVGTDRTGFIGYLLNGLLGVPKETLLRDYLFSNFGNIGGSRSVGSIQNLYLTMLDEQPGSTLSEKIEYYLINTIGITKDDVNSIKYILIEGHTYTKSVIKTATCTVRGEIRYTCTDDASLSFTKYIDRLDHDYEEITSSVLRCTVCGQEKARADLPGDYTPVDYIVSNGTQYINTGVTVSNNTRVTAEIDFATTSSAVAFGYRQSSSAKQYLFSVADGYYLSGYGAQQKSLNGSAFSLVNYPNLSFIVDSNKAELYIDGVKVGTHTAATFTGGNLYVFALNDNGTANNFASVKLYSMQVFNNGTLVRDFVPCYRTADFKFGLYDLVNGVFYLNDGTGLFDYGLDGSEYKGEERLPALYDDAKAVVMDGGKIETTATSTGAFLVDGAEVSNGQNYMITVNLDEVSAKHVGFVAGTLANNGKNHVMFDWRYTSRHDIYVWRNSPYGWIGFDSTDPAGKPLPDLTCEIPHRPSTLTFIYKNGTYYMYVDLEKVMELSEDQEFSWGTSTVKSIVGTTGNIKLGITTYTGSATFSNFTLTTNTTAINNFIAGKVLPSGYSVVSYIESTGTQYIDTGFAPDSNTTVVAIMDFAKTTDSSSHAAFSARGAKEYGFLSYSNNYISRYADDQYLSLSYSGKMAVVMDKNVLKVDGTTVCTHTATVFSCGCNLYIFACNQNGSVKSGSYASLKLYSMKIYDSGTLVRDYIPCVREEDGMAGLYDRVNGVFYANSGTGLFNCQYTPEVPSGYTAVNYIESTGTQYIDTGFKANNNTRVVATMDFASSSTSYYAYGYRKSSSVDKFAFSTVESVYVTNYGTVEKYLGKYSGFDAFSYPNGKFIVDRNKTELFINGVKVGENTAQTFTCAGNLYVFALNNNGSVSRNSSLKLYAMKIYDNGTLVRDFVPCTRDSDSVAGLYDRVNGTFYTNGGTGTFNAG